MAFVVPKECYINFKLDFDWQTGELNTENLPLGFATYKEDNKAFEKRKETIDNWSGLKNTKYLQDSQGRTLRDNDGSPVVQVTEGERPMETFANEVLLGFKISKEIKRGGWNGGNVVWRIEDPRGFELEISSQNMAQIMMNCTITNGEIGTPCLWSWDKTGGSRIVLLPEGSEPYVEAMKDNELHEANVSLKDIKVLDKIQLKNGAEGTYYGCVEVITYDYIAHSYNYGWSNQQPENSLRRNAKNKWEMTGDTIGNEYFTRKRYILKLEDGTFYSISNMKPARILSKSELSLTSTQVVNEINQSILDGNVITDDVEMSSYRDNYSNSNIVAVGESKKDLKDFQLKFVPTDDEISFSGHARDEFDGEKVFVDDYGFFVFQSGHSGNSHGAVYRINTQRLQDKLLYSIKESESKSATDLGQMYYVAIEVNNNTYLINTRW